MVTNIPTKPRAARAVGGAGSCILTLLMRNYLFFAERVWTGRACEHTTISRVSDAE